MRYQRRLGPFKGVVSARGDFAPEGSASDALNARSRGGGLTPRNGFQRLTSRPQSATETFGLIHLRGYGDEYVAKEELVLIRKDGSGPVQPYSVPLPLGVGEPTLAEITNGTADVELEELPVGGFVFGGDGYIYQPGAAKSLYKHEIGTNDSWTTVQDVDAEPTPDDPQFSATALDTTDVSYSPGSDTIAFTDPSQTGTPTHVDTAQTIVLKAGSVNDDGNDGTCVLTVTYATAYPVTEGREYVSIAVDAGGNGQIMRVIRSGGAKLELDFGSGFVEVTDKFVSGGNTAAFAITGKIPNSVTLPDSLAAYRLTFKGSIYNDGSTIATVHRLQIGGEFLCATTSAQRSWLGNVPEQEITYGARIRNTVSSAVTDIKQATLNASAIAGPVARNTSIELGNRVTVYYDSDGPYTNLEVQFLRKTVGGDWKLIGTVNPATAGATFTDHYREDELAALTTITGTESDMADPLPPFTTQGLKGGVPYKGWVVWLFEGGTRNVRHSRFGDPLEIRDEDLSYDPDDTTRPADQTLADGYDDEPVAGFQAGQTLVLLGQRGVYTSYGDYGAQMTPPRRVPETSGVVGFRACCRWKASSGGYGVAWLDASGNVWSLLSAPRFEGDASARPDELSMALRGNLREFLTGSEGGDLSGAMLAYDEAEDSLFVVLGQKAAVLRPRDAVDGAEHWDLYRYNVVEDAWGATTTTAWSSVSSPSQGGGGASWSYGPPDTVELVSAGASSQLLTRTGFLAGLPPVGQTESSVEARLTDTDDPLLTVTYTPNTAGRSATLDVTRNDYASWYDLDNWLITMPADTTIAAQTANISVSETKTATAVWNGTDPAPTGQMVWGFTSRVEGGFVTNGGGTKTGQFTGTDPTGTTNTALSFGPVAFPDTNVYRGERIGNGELTVDVIGGVCSIPVPLSLTVTTTGGTKSGSLELDSVGPVEPDPVDYSGTIEMRMTHTGGAPEADGTFTALAFAGPALYALRSDATVCALERDARTGAPLRYDADDLPNIDAGRAMPAGYWRFGDWEAGRARLAGVRQVLDGGGATSFSLVTDEKTVGVSPGERRWQAFPFTAAGNRMAFRIDFDQTLGRIDSLTLELTRLSEKKLS